MDALIQYAIPVKGLRPGDHQYEFDIDQAFFAAFEGSPVTEGQVHIELDFDKRPDLIVLTFDISGTVKTECDRCLAAIHLPIEDQQQLIVKFSEEEVPEEADVVFIHPESAQLNVARYIYEFICLAIPMIRVYDCESESPRPCNEEMLRYLKNTENPDVEQDDKPDNPVWDVLKNLDPGDN